MEKYRFSAPCIFGIEKVLGDELKRMEAEDVSVFNGRVDFSGDGNMLARANIGSRYAERILIKLREFPATSFEELFEGVSKIPFENFIKKDDAFPVKGWSIDSGLHSIPDCQSIIKKAIVKRLSAKYGLSWFPETDSVIPIRFSILKDTVSITIDTSGDGLHKRGYRRNSNAAPLKETLAAAMCDIARIYPDTVIFDPFCGSGTILIEAALKAANIAPGLHRYFAAEKFSFTDKECFRLERQRATDLVRHGIEFQATGYDIDQNSVELTLSNAKKAGVEKYIKAYTQSIDDFSLPDGRTLVITNPPYGERLLELREAEEIYKTMGKVFDAKDEKKYYIISPHDDFEKLFGRPADKRRKLYNGMIKCQYYMYFRGK